MNTGILQLTSQQIVKEKIFNLINNSNLCPGDKIQSQNQLAKALNVGPMTVHNALKEFVEEGTLRRVKGKGTFIVKTSNSVNPLKLALVLARPGLDKANENPDSWYRVQFLMQYLLGSLDDDSTLSTVICSPDEKYNKVRNRLKEYDVLIFSGAEEFSNMINDVISENLIQVMIIGANCRQHNCLIVEADRDKNTNTAINYLINSGHRRIAFLGSDLFDQKFDSYKKTLAEYGIPYDEKIVIRGLNHAIDGKRGTSLLVNRNENFDAVFVDSDLKAIEVVRQFQQLGVRVPHDISVIGYGESTIVGFEKKLTVVDVPYQSMIAESMTLLKQWAQTDRQPISKLISIDGKVVIGETSMSRLK